MLSEDEEIDPLSILGKYCYVKAAIKIESIFIGQSISLQVKLYEALIDEIETKDSNLMKRPKANPIVEEEVIEEEEIEEESEEEVSDE